MNKIILKALSCFSLISLLSCESKTEYCIEGNIDSLEGWIYLELDSRIKDSVFVNDGSFRFEGVQKTEVSGKITNNHSLFVYLIPDTKEIKINGSMEDWTTIKVTGSPMTDKNIMISDELNKICENVFQFKGETRDSLYKSYKNEIKKVISENKDNVIGVLLLERNAYYLGPEQVIEVGLNLSHDMQEMQTFKDCKSVAEKQISTRAGNKFIDFQLNDTIGNSVSLSDILGKEKLVYLDFWGSGCRPCIRTFPRLKEIYDKYSPLGFEVVGVSLDENEWAWKNMINKQQLPWINLSSLQGWTCPVAADYGVTWIPKGFLINSEGIIVKDNIYPEPLISVLDSIYGVNIGETLIDRGGKD